MKTSARNVFHGRVAAVRRGAVNSEVSLRLRGGEEIVATITNESVRRLRLKAGAGAFALVKASWVILAIPDEGVLLSARNRFQGIVVEAKRGAVNAEVAVALSGGEALTATITNASLRSLSLKKGTPIEAFFKASAVVLGVRKDSK